MKLAIISLSTFGYFERLAEHVGHKGVPAAFFDERPSNSVATKLLYRAVPKRIGRRIGRRHIQKMCERIVAEGYSHALLVFAEIISKEHILYLKQNGIRVARYTWDSVGNRPNVQDLDPYMEAIGSFDPEDCAQYGYVYIPLYSEIITPELVRREAERSQDLFFCGTMHSNRPELIYQIDAAARRNGWSILLMLFFHARWLYVLRNFASWRAMRLLPRISPRPFGHAEVLEAARDTRIVIDIPHPRQQGLTMRSFETLAQGAILLTTNANAAALLPTALADRIVHLDAGNVEASLQAAFARRSGPLPAEIYDTLSVERFLDRIFALVGIEAPAPAAAREPGRG